LVILGEVAGHSKAYAERRAALRNDGGVDAHHLAVHVEQRPAGIALVDRRVGLDELVVWPRFDVAVARRYDAQRHRAAQPERVADGHHPVAHHRPVAIAEFDEWQVTTRFDLQHGEVHLVVRSDDLRRQPRPVGEEDVDLLGPLDHVVVGDDEAVLADDEARAEAARLLHHLVALPLVGVVLVEHRPKRRAVRNLGKRHATTTGDMPGGADIDHGRGEFFGQRRHRFRPLREGRRR
jgi:hypothetical protein